MSKIDISILTKLGDIELDKNTGKSCIFQKIIERFPVDNQEQVINIIENPNTYTTVAALKIIRKTGIKDGCEDSLKKHRRKSCICYI